MKYCLSLKPFPDMTSKHRIAIKKPPTLPIPNRLPPSHYGLLYYIKGAKPRVFDRDLVRTPVQTCRHCGKDVKDYGGQQKNPQPQNLNLNAACGYRASGRPPTNKKISPQGLRTHTRG